MTQYGWQPMQKLQFCPPALIGQHFWEGWVALLPLRTVAIKTRVLLVH